MRINLYRKGGRRFTSYAYSFEIDEGNSDMKKPCLVSDGAGLELSVRKTSKLAVDRMVIATAHYEFCDTAFLDCLTKFFAKLLAATRRNQIPLRGRNQIAQLKFGADRELLSRFCGNHKSGHPIGRFRLFRRAEVFMQDRNDCIFYFLFSFLSVGGEGTSQESGDRQSEGEHVDSPFAMASESYLNNLQKSLNLFQMKFRWFFPSGHNRRENHQLTPAAKTAARIEWLRDVRSEGA